MCTRSEMEATWTPSDPDDGSGPLPLSMRQRQQLLKLEDTIRSSSNPQETLMKVAGANQMDPQELVNLLHRNRLDMEQGIGVPRQRNVWQSLASAGVLGGQWVKKHPRLSTAVGASFLLTLYTSWTVPRTGFVVSTKSTLFSKGATTLWNPPTSYLEQVLEDLSDRPISVSEKLHREVADLLNKYAEKIDPAMNDAEPVWLRDIPNKRSSDIQRAVTVSASLDIEELRGNYKDAEDDLVMEASWEQALSLLQKRALTEFVQPNGFLRFVSSDQDGLLVVRKLGDWGGYGLVPMRIAANSDKLDTEKSSLVLTLNTVKGAHWDGQIHVQFTLGETSLNTRVTMIFTQGGKSLSRNMATRIVQALQDSLLASLRTRARQALARQSQSIRFQNAARDKATNRRTSRAVKERAIEEMSTDRRRRWQRANPNSGSYRPSGDRMRSPNNAVY